MSALFGSLNTFVTANKEKVDASGDAAPAKPSKAEKMAARALRVATKTHKIVCALSNWTRDVHAPSLAENSNKNIVLDDAFTALQLYLTIRAAALTANRMVKAFFSGHKSSPRNTALNNKVFHRFERQEICILGKRGVTKDIAILVSTLKIQSIEKMANRPISRAKYFDFESLKTKGWNLKKFTDPQCWSSFFSTQCQTFPDLTFPDLVKEQNEEKFLKSTVKGVRIQVSHNFLSDILNIPNEGNKLHNSWFSSVGVTREQLLEEYIKPNHDINSTNLEDTPKILHNMIRHTLLPRCGSFKAITDTDLCIIHHLITKTKLNLCFVMLQHMMDQCHSFKQKVAGLPYGMHLTPIFEAAGISLDKEKGQDTFMRFTAKIISQLHITTSNMPIPQKTGSVKRLADQKVQEVRKKQKADKPAKKEIGSSSQKVEKEKATPALEVFAHVAEHTRELVEASQEQFEAMLAKKAAEKFREFDADHQKVEDSLNKDTREVVEILVSNSFGSQNQPMDVDEEAVLEQENVEAHPYFDLNIEDTTNDLYNEIFQDAQGEQIQQGDQNVQNNTDQNVPTAPVEQLSVDPNPFASGSLPSKEVQLLAQPGQNVQRDQNVPSAQNMEHVQFVNL
ncbi:hypothetical protein MTR_2g460520 [Medicago truncatula]|uniref:Putative plant transposon protein domain-containing protein n=1 Tax=Medicago truncatula TaxID=3880 RepID=A0A072V8A2_MEDTR|nr:hypothetical protein MTR_2g460520 [Medicago truncatula]